MEFKKPLHYTPLVLLTVFLLVRPPLSYMQIKSLFASSVNAHFASNYRTLSPLWPDTTSPPFFLVWLKVPVIVFQIDILARTDLLGPLTAILSGCYWCPSVSIIPRDVGGPSGSLRGLWIVISLDARRLSGCKRKSSLAPVSVSSALNVYRPSWSKSTATYSSLASFSNLQWDEFRDLNYPFSRWSYFLSRL